jgi:hypothetical protein
MVSRKHQNKKVPFFRSCNASLIYLYNSRFFHYSLLYIFLHTFSFLSLSFSNVTSLITYLIFLSSYPFSLTERKRKFKLLTAFGFFEGRGQKFGFSMLQLKDGAWTQNKIFSSHPAIFKEKVNSFHKWPWILYFIFVICALLWFCCGSFGSIPCNQDLYVVFKIGGSFSSTIIIKTTHLNEYYYFPNQDLCYIII